MSVSLNRKKIKPFSIVGRTLSLYDDIDKFVSSSSKPSCIDGCCQCCNDYFYIYEWEFYTILFYLVNLNDDDYLSSKINYSKECIEHIKINNLEEYRRLNSQNKPQIPGELMLPQHNLGIKCPFLSCNNRCEIYEVRPLMCREYGVFEHTYCDKITNQKFINIDEFKGNNRISRIMYPNGTFRIPYPIIEWLGSMARPILASNKLKLSYSVSDFDFYNR